MNIIKIKLKIETKVSDVPIFFLSRPQKSRVSRVSGNETFFFFALYNGSFG